ncbi:hypothetical protein D3C77_735210 [compost metagenome]
MRAYSANGSMMYGFGVLRSWAKLITGISSSAQSALLNIFRIKIAPRLDVHFAFQDDLEALSRADSLGGNNVQILLSEWCCLLPRAFANITGI